MKSRLAGRAGLCFVLFWVGSGCLVAQTNVLTYHNDNARTGQNINEKVLTPANVNSAHFGKLYSVNLDGNVYAQPLVVTNVSIPGQGTHNVVYVVTENDSLYAIDADHGKLFWRISFINPSVGITTVPSSGFCTNISPQIGITGTPVIDVSGHTIYLVAKTKENGAYVQRLHAIDIATKAEKFGGPVVVEATVAGTGAGSKNGNVSFDPLINNQRAGLLLQNGHLIIAWGSHCDRSPFRGWIMSYNAGTLSQEAVLALNPNGSGGSVWMGGGGLAADANSNLYFATGNGDYDGSTEFGDSILKVHGPSASSFSVLDWFTPYDQAAMDTNDWDLGSGGVLLLPDLPSGFTHRQLLVQASKKGTIYLIDRNNMGQYCSGCTSATGNTQIVQQIPNALKGMWGVPAYWNGNLYFGGAYYTSGAADTVKAFSFNANGSGLMSRAPISHTTQSFNYPAPTPSVSANGTAAGIVWAVDKNASVLHAYSAANLAAELYNTTQAPNSRDALGSAVKFAVPTVANGKVYVGSATRLNIYGLLPVAATPTFSPVAGTYHAVESVSISDSSPGVTIHYTTNGTTPTTSSSVYTGPITVSTTMTIKAIAAGGSFSASAVGSATYTLTAATPTFSPVAGTYHVAQSASISDSSPGVTIHYTTNGSTPTTSSPVYTGAIRVSTTTTIKAIAVGGGFATGGVGTATYVIQ